MEKPLSMSTKSFLIRKLSVDTMTPEKIIEAVINYQFLGVLEAMKTNKIIEFSGWGRFGLSVNKTLKQIEKDIKNKEYWEEFLKKDDISIQSRNSTMVKLENVINDINVLKLRINA